MEKACGRKLRMNGQLDNPNPTNTHAQQHTFSSDNSARMISFVLVELMCERAEMWVGVDDMNGDLIVM